MVARIARRRATESLFKINKGQEKGQASKRRLPKKRGETPNRTACPKSLLVEASSELWQPLPVAGVGTPKAFRLVLSPAGRE
jgi:hypothetical protein